MVAIVFLLCSFSFFSTAEVSAATEGDYEYTENDGKITITKYTGSAKELEIPSTIAEKPVTAIGETVFGNKGLTKVTLPSSLETIGEGAFTNNQLADITIPSSVKTIGVYAFRNTPLTNVTIENGVTTIGDQAFSNAKLTSVTIPSSVTTIGEFAFSVNKLTNVTIPSSVMTIGAYAFSNNELTNVKLLNSQTSIGENAFPNSGGNLKLIACSPSTAKDYAAKNSHEFEVDKVCPSPTVGTGSIEVTVFKHDKKTAISEALQVTITDKSGYVFTGDNDKLASGTFTSSSTLAKGTYYVTISNGKVTQTTEVKVTNKKAVAKLYWASTVADLKDDNGLIKKSGAIQGLVYNGADDTAQVTSGATVTIVSKTTRWSTTTDTNGSFNVYVPTGTYDVIVEGKDAEKADDKKNILYPKVKVIAGQVSAPLDQLNAGLAWGDTDKKLGFSVDEASLTGTSKAFKGKALASSTVSVYTVSGNSKIWVAEMKTKKTGEFNLKIPLLAGKKVVFVVRDEAGNEYVSEGKDIPKIDAPALSASAAKGVAVDTTKIKVKKEENNKIVVIASKQATTTPKLGDAAPTTSDSAILFLNDYESDKEITVKGATHAAVYEVSAIGEIVRFKDVPLAGKIKE